MCINYKKMVYGDVKMRTNIELDDTLVKKAMDITKISTKKALINKALEELIKSNTRKGMLKFMDSGIWEGDLKKCEKCDEFNRRFECLD
jgi:Arc/MetJ family transcription regulator